MNEWKDFLWDKIILFAQSADRAALLALCLLLPERDSITDIIGGLYIDYDRKVESLTRLQNLLGER